MLATALRTTCTVDTHEILDGVRVLTDAHEDGGYEWMEKIEEEGWVACGAWGVDGWDLGQWPYVMVAVTKTADKAGPLFGMATYCEGDVKTTFYRTQAAHWAAITAEAFNTWKSRSDGPPNMPETADQLAPEYCQPYSLNLC